MRVLLVGTAVERATLRSALDGAGVEIAGEFETLAEARSARLDADAILLPGERGSRPAPAHADGWIDEPLTPREIQVLELLAEGLSNRSIAGRLGISDQTVKFHVASIYGKLGAANRTEAVRLALRRGLISL